ncbi:AraC family transcriptional regulator [Pseudomonas sp. F1_0610]|uniref:AraC family transcriptional regulator n=1 Tax=Pseudomonas sp. F1_0610 TaxID=3114284 RepID=UPI0039C30676
MTKKQHDIYTQRFAKVLHYIEQHLDETLSVESLSCEAHFSVFHFHRLFSAYYGVSVGRYIQWLKLKRASYQLAFNHHQKIIDIALAAGFQSPESFTRAFKQACGQSPRQFRQQPNWLQWHARKPNPNYQKVQVMDVKIVNFPETKVATIEHRGAIELIFQTAATFFEWRKATGLSPVATSQTYALAPCDPQTTEPKDFRFSLCGSVTQAIDENNSYGIKNAVIPAGRCAVARHLGSHDRISDTAYYLYRQWLLETGEQLRDYPLFFQYHNFIYDVAEHELVTDVYLPLV